MSDQTGSPEVWVATPDVPESFPTRILASTLNWMPDSKSLLYTTSDHKLNMVNVESGQSKMLATNESSGITGVTVSPDGAWIAFSKSDRDFRQHVYFLAASGGEAHELPDALQNSQVSITSTVDGKKLIFLGGYVQAELRGARMASAIYSVILSKYGFDEP